jgi:hypothetical protein
VGADTVDRYSGTRGVRIYADSRVEQVESADAVIALIPLSRMFRPWEGTVAQVVASTPTIMIALPIRRTHRTDSATL